MKHQYHSFNPSRIRQAGAAVAAAFLLSGCSGLFDVDNPNDLAQEDLEKPSSAVALANGAEATVSRGYADALLAAAIPTDELVWVGSYDAGRELDLGFVSNPSNEFSDNESWATLTEGRFTADEAIRLLNEFDAAGDLANRNLLARSYLYGGLIYAVIPDWYEDFVISTKKDAQPPVGEANMGKLYDTAIGYFTSGLDIARSTKNTSLEGALLGARARAHHAKAVWTMLNPAGSTPANPLVNSASAVADAQAALAIVPEDWKYQFQFSAATIGSQLGSWINSRQEFRVDTVFGVSNERGNKITAVQLRDPIDNIPDPALQRLLTEFGALSTGTELYPPLTVISARELRLIIAESALAAGDMAAFTQQINAVRALEAELSPYSGQIPALQMLMHERKANLFLQGRRLNDMYRFGVSDARWQPSSTAATKPGTVFSIADRELRTNCHFTGGC
jgi:hypothetical protein